MNLKEIIYSIPLKELKDKVVCYKCILTDSSIKNALYDKEQMERSRFGNYNICPNCYYDELEEGYEKIGKTQVNRIFSIINEFEKYKEERLKIIKKDFSKR
ncbi:MAG: hypothetical protein AABW81_03765 [Nanoarchaeota archaeon]